jgi:hypothetical protein
MDAHESVMLDGVLMHKVRTYGEACAAAAVAAERERMRDSLMLLNKQACGLHNYYHVAVIKLLGDKP